MEKYLKMCYALSGMFFSKNEDDLKDIRSDSFGNPNDIHGKAGGFITFDYENYLDRKDFPHVFLEGTRYNVESVCFRFDGRALRLILEGREYPLTIDFDDQEVSEESLKDMNLTEVLYDAYYESTGTLDEFEDFYEAVDLDSFVIVTWPDVTKLMKHRSFWKNAYLINDKVGFDEFGYCAYFVRKAWKERVEKLKNNPNI